MYFYSAWMENTNSHESLRKRPCVDALLVDDLAGKFTGKFM